MLLSFPNALLVRAYLRRGVGLWVASRVLLAMVLAFAELEPIRLSTAGSIQLVLVTALVAWVDLHRRKERALLGNLGVSRAFIVAICALPAAVGETILALSGLAG